MKKIEFSHLGKKWKTILTCHNHFKVLNLNKESAVTNTTANNLEIIENLTILRLQSKTSHAEK